MRLRHTLSAAALAIALLLAGCAKNVTASHPNAINSFDSYAYDTLTASQAGLQDGKHKYHCTYEPVAPQDGCTAADVVPSTVVAQATLHDLVNAAGASYNLARTNWLSYRQIIQAGGDATKLQATLQQNLADTLAAIAALQKALGVKP